MIFFNIKSKKLISSFKRLVGEEPNNSETKLSNKGKINHTVPEI